MDAKELLVHPVTALAAFVSVIGQFGFGWFEPVWGLISTTSGMWFPAIAVTAGTIFPEVGLSDLGTPVLLGAALLFVAVQLDRLGERVMRWLENRQ
jgi:hypothetical protein